jgi:PilZ domain
MQAATIVDLPKAFSERRTSARHVAVILIAKLSMADEQTVCRIRNLSATGALIETTIRLAVGQAVVLELRSDLCMMGRIMWTNDANAGVRFEATIDVSRYLQRPENKIDRIKARAPRYRCWADAVIAFDNGDFRCKVIDIGLSGVRLSKLPDRTSLRQGHLLKFATDGLCPHHASIAWIDGENAGIKFRHPLKYTELQHWLGGNSPDSSAIQHSSACAQSEHWKRSPQLIDSKAKRDAGTNSCG